MTRRIAGYLFLVLLATASLLDGQQRRWPDRPYLTMVADSVGIDVPATLAIAWEESAANLDPALRGHRCWWSVDLVTLAQQIQDGTRAVRAGPWDRIRQDKSGKWRLVHHESNCEIGRFQIKPSTAKLRCPGLNIFTYAGNVRCFVKMFAEDTKQRDRLFAIRNQNGKGDKAEAYLGRVLQTIGWITETETP